MVRAIGRLPQRAQFNWSICQVEQQHSTASTTHHHLLNVLWTGKIVWSNTIPSASAVILFRTYLLNSPSIYVINEFSWRLLFRNKLFSFFWCEKHTSRSIVRTYIREGKRRANKLVAKLAWMEILIGAHLIFQHNEKVCLLFHLLSYSTALSFLQLLRFIDFCLIVFRLVTSHAVEYHSMKQAVLSYLTEKWI